MNQAHKPMLAAKNKVFVIDDDEIVRFSCEKILRQAGYAVEVFEDGYRGIAQLEDAKPDSLIVDIRMPGMDGFECMRQARRIDPDIVIIVITGYATIGSAVDAMKLGACDFLPKPFAPNDLLEILEQGLARRTQAVEAHRRQKEKEGIERRFVTLVSHQFKAPLGAVKQYLDVLLYSHGDRFPGDTLEWISRSQLRISEMLQLVQDWLLLGRLEHGMLCDRAASSDLAQLAETIVGQYRQLPSASGLSFQTDIAPALEKVQGDAASLNLVIGNLLSNAVKYNKPGGSIAVRARKTDDAWIALEICDTGWGIPQAFRPYLFEEFHRARTLETQDIPGTGLGLVLCRKILSELGGSLDVDSKEGEYTRFTLRLPIAGSALLAPL